MKKIVKTFEKFNRPELIDGLDLVDKMSVDDFMSNVDKFLAHPVEFMESVFEFMSFYGWGEIMNPSVYGKVRRCDNDIIYCSVEFEDGCKSYYYISDDDSIQVGDFVIVPAGKDNHEAVVEVVKKEYFAEENVPLPMEKTKHIIRKCTEDNFDLPDDGSI